jgi:hypothetical protein
MKYLYFYCKLPIAENGGMVCLIRAEKMYVLLQENKFTINNIVESAPGFGCTRTRLDKVDSLVTDTSTATIISKCS